MDNEGKISVCGCDEMGAVEVINRASGQMQVLYYGGGGEGGRGKRGGL